MRQFNLLMVLLAVLWAAPLNAQQCVPLEDFSSSAANSFPTGWSPREESGKKTYSVQKDGERFFLHARAAGGKAEGNGVEADRSVKWNISEYPILQWQWRARAFPRGADERSGKDDSALGVYVGFCPPEDLQLCEKSVKGNLSLSDRIALPKLLFSKGVGSLKYIWSERLPKGSEFENNHKMVKVLQSGAPGNRDQWVQERVNVAADYRRSFGAQQALNPVGISVLTDSDDTRSTAEGDYANFQVCRE